VVRSELANAFVLPNNHVFVYTGLFKFVKDEDELAAVLGHEMAHNLARHAGERLSESFLTNILARFVLILDPSGLLYSIFVPAATLLHDLPHSREHEVEADHIGMHLAAEACYDPRAAARVFSAMKHGHEDHREDWSSRITTANPPEFISTHPSYETRITNFEEWMPEAMVKFNADDGLKCRLVREEMKLARQRAALEAARRESTREPVKTAGKSQPPPEHTTSYEPF
jgi:Zn-dependent protease with chaperone function